MSRFFKAAILYKVQQQELETGNRPQGIRRQEEIDRILDKISHSGYDSLTAKEKEILFKASK